MEITFLSPPHLIQGRFLFLPLIQPYKKSPETRLVVSLGVRVLLMLGYRRVYAALIRIANQEFLSFLTLSLPSSQLSALGKT